MRYGGGAFRNEGGAFMDQDRVHREEDGEMKAGHSEMRLNEYIPSEHHQNPQTYRDSRHPCLLGFPKTRSLLVLLFT